MIKQRLQHHHQQQQHQHHNRCNNSSNTNNNVDNSNNNDDSKNDNVVVDDDDDDVIKIRIPSYVNKTLMKLPCCCCSSSILKYIKDHMATCAASIIGLKLMCVLMCFLVKIIVASTLVYYGVTNELFIHNKQQQEESIKTAATTTKLTIGIQQTRITTDPHNILLSPQQQEEEEEEVVVVEKPSLRILYILTSLSEYNNGLRNTIRGQDRLYEIVIPLLVDNVESMIMKPFYYDVDIYIITAYTLSKERYQYIRNRIPRKVNIYIWDDALPLGYDKPYKDNTIISNNTRALARQHRYVVKDNLEKYDLFLAFEDDMRITGYHIEHYMAMENAIQILRDNAPTELLPNDEMSEQVSMDSTEPYKQDPYQQKFYGTLTKRQFDRIIPGFIRVEVNLHPNIRNTQQTLDPIPRDYSFSIPSSLLSSNDYINNSTTTTTTSTSTSTSSFNSHFDPYYCCNVENMSPNVQNIPINPDMEDVLIWETSIKALTVRKMPTTQQQQQQQQQSSTSSSSSSLSSLSLMNELLDWVVLLPGTGKRLSLDDWMGGYWSGRKHQFGIDSTKPSSGEPSLIAQQGGWMLTREQIQRINNLKLCQGSFLPPFNEPIYKNDGLESNNVEYWSGGYQLYTGVLGGCNMQRIMSTHPIHISKHFIYHIANNKQKQLSQQRLVRVDDLYGQINTVRKLAIEDMNNIINTTTTTTNNNNINNNDGTTTTEKKKRKKNKMMMKKKKK